jgi:hypothetical protein
MKTKIDPQEKRDAARYKVIATGQKIKAVNVAYGTYKDIKTGQRYMFDEIEYLGERRHMVQIRFHIWRFGLCLYCREYLKYNSWFIFPGVTVDAVNGYDRYLDVELKALFVGVGIRFIWIKRKGKR